VKHLIISRVNLHMRLDPNKYKVTELWKQPGWNESRVRMLDEWTRRSLRKQTNQDFTFVTLWQAGHVHQGGGLANEVKIEIENTGTSDDDPLDYNALWNNAPGKKTLNFSDQIAYRIRQRFKAPALITNLDCDDCLRYDFVEVLQREAAKYSDFTILDMQDRYQYNIRTGAKGVKSSRRASPFLSCVEPEIKCIPIIYNHSDMPVDISIKKIPDLAGMQTINSSNMFVSGTGNKGTFKLEDYV
jgi:hypothetical protein